jgi:hypothetical protein
MDEMQLPVSLVSPAYTASGHPHRCPHPVGFGRRTSLEPGRSWWDAPPLSQLSSFGVRSSARLGAQIIRAALADEAR